MGKDDYTVGENYVLPRDESEYHRLNVQHTFLRTMVYDGRLIYDESVALDAGSVVLDSGTGTGAWILDLAKEVPSTVELHGCDVSANNFPKIHPPNVHLHEASSTKLPQEWTGKFDVVNQRMLMGALLASEWPIVLSEIMRVLKPGGYVQFAEMDLLNLVMAGPATLRFRDLSVPFYKKLGLMLDAAQQLPRLASEAGFVNITSEKKYGATGKSWGKLGELGTESNGDAIKNIGPKMVRNGIMTEEDFRQIYSGAVDEFATREGTRFVYRMVCARKPL